MRLVGRVLVQVLDVRLPCRDRGEREGRWCMIFVLGLGEVGKEGKGECCILRRCSNYEIMIKP